MLFLNYLCGVKIFLTVHLLRKTEARNIGGMKIESEKSTVIDEEPVPVPIYLYCVPFWLR